MVGYSSVKSVKNTSPCSSQNKPKRLHAHFMPSSCVTWNSSKHWQLYHCNRYLIHSSHPFFCPRMMVEIRSIYKKVQNFAFLIWIWIDSESANPSVIFSTTQECVFMVCSDKSAVNHTWWLTHELHRLTEGISVTNNIDIIFQWVSAFHAFSLFFFCLCCFVRFLFFVYSRQEEETKYIH